MRARLVDGRLAVGEMVYSKGKNVIKRKIIEAGGRGTNDYFHGPYRELVIF